MCRDGAEEHLAVLAPLPDLAGEALLARGDLSHVAIERGVVLRAVEQVRAAAGDFLVAVSGHAGERRVDRDESEIVVVAGYRLVHVAQHGTGDPAPALDVAVVGAVERGTRQAPHVSCGVARHPAPPGPDPNHFPP